MFYDVMNMENQYHFNALLPSGKVIIADITLITIFRQLLQNEQFRRKFIDTYCIVGGSVFEPTRTGKIVDELVNNVKGMCQLMKNIAGQSWGSNLGRGHNVENSAKTIKNNINSSRSATMTNYLT